MEPRSAPGPKPETPLKVKIQWTLALGLCGVTLVAAWITAQRRKEERLAARGAVLRDPGAEAPARLRLKLGPEGQVTGLPTRTFAAYLAEHSKSEPIDLELDPAATVGGQREILEAAARAGVPIRWVLGESGVARIRILPGERRRVENFILEARPDASAFRVDTAQGTPCVEFLGIVRGQVRRWMELELRFLEVEPVAHTIQIALRPGAACLGAGRYFISRAGLRIDFSGGRTCTVTEARIPGPRIKASFEREGEALVRVIPPGGQGEAIGLRYRLLPGSDPSEGGSLVLEEE
jgi:hypothetical protein